MRAATVFALGLCALAAGCLPVYRSSLQEIPPGAPGFEEIVQVRFLGVGGFSLRKGEDVVLTAPLYSNPSIEELDRRKSLTPKAALIEKFHPQTDGVKAILVGHAHYDHLMDVPWVWARTPEAMIYGNSSVKNILAGYAPGAGGNDVPRIPTDKVVAIDHAGEDLVDYRMCIQKRGPRELAPGRIDDSELAGRWIQVPGSRVRIRALCSSHPPQILSSIHLWPGCIHHPRFAPPSSSEDYQEGETIAYLIDFLAEDGRTPVFRIYYQDAPTNPTIGEIPEDLRREKAVDLALLCVGTFFGVEEPTHIVDNTDARYIILGHWENFFRPQDQKLKGIPFAKVKKVVSEVRKASPEAEVFLPAPQTVFHLRQGARGVEMVGARE
jgi:L-ascorbate metabolism protein UlaG (beta-lactamase superfamily)